MVTTQLEGSNNWRNVRVMSVSMWAMVYLKYLRLWTGGEMFLDSNSIQVGRRRAVHDLARILASGWNRNP